MSSKEIKKWCSNQDTSSGILEIPEELFNSLDAAGANQITEFFRNNILIKLPDREIAFSEWLKSEDPDVWNDLWKNPEQQPYIVSIAFLPLLIDKLTGFPICDLMLNDNYYFTDDHIADKEAQIFTESSKQRFMDKEKLTIGQALMMQISVQPVDIWHFSYYFGINLNQAKETVKQLSDERMLIHIKLANHLAPFIRF